MGNIATTRPLAGAGKGEAPPLPLGHPGAPVPELRPRNIAAMAIIWAILAAGAETELLGDLSVAFAVTIAFSVTLVYGTAAWRVLGFGGS